MKLNALTGLSKVNKEFISRQERLLHEVQNILVGDQRPEVSSIIDDMGKGDREHYYKSIITKYETLWENWKKRDVKVLLLIDAILKGSINKKDNNGSRNQDGLTYYKQLVERDYSHVKNFVDKFTDVVNSITKD